MALLIRRIVFYVCSSRIFSLPEFGRSGELCSKFAMAFLAISFTAVAAGPSVARAAAPAAHWGVSWGASPSPPPDEAHIRTQGLEFNNQTLREIVHLSIGSPAGRGVFATFFCRAGREHGFA